MRVFCCVAAGASTVLLVAGALLASPDPSVIVTLREAGGVGEIIGTVQFEDTGYNLLILPDLRKLQAGPHAAHDQGKCGLRLYCGVIR
jgi:Cu/Zn superoxide dismutase